MARQRGPKTGQTNRDARAAFKRKQVMYRVLEERVCKVERERERLEAKRTLFGSRYGMRPGTIISHIL